MAITARDEEDSQDKGGNHHTTFYNSGVCIVLRGAKQETLQEHRHPASKYLSSKSHAPTPLPLDSLRGAGCVSTMAELERSSSQTEGEVSSEATATPSYERLKAKNEEEQNEEEQLPAWIRYMPRPLSKIPSLSASPGLVSPAPPTPLRCSMRPSANRFSTNIALQRIIMDREKRKRESASAESVPESESDEVRVRRKRRRGGGSVVECEALLSFARL